MITAGTTIVLSLVLTVAFTVVNKLIRPLDSAWLAVLWAVFVLPISGVLPTFLQWRQRRSTSA